ncbi:MAG: 30S ribosomal protein S5 [Geminocystis sp.]|nr:30S ribosomal protein S5 [Geminocystis sp.]HIK38037.1 30S ribosomal protein S5 [Geminocystis sp. M7585_C2015_104]MCS7147188.1 30S ribosomal protein S5 [Geminocystis sp.]MCX8078587.1 30S ribosomal protein S5 [Geminocystis sp.]MDW8116184.1 30S ribosomal protein S5 [Geminocystis sp.]
MAKEQEQRSKTKQKKRKEKKETQWLERVVQIRRVSKVVQGGKKLSFRAIVVVGNERGQVGVGVGKAGDVINAVRKAVADGKKNIISVKINKDESIPHAAQASYGSATVFMRPAAPGTGVIAGGSVRTVLELAGIKNILAKQLGSNNPLNNARATIKALQQVRSFSQVSKERDIPLQHIFS